MRALLVAAIAALTASAGGASCAEWPTRPLRFIVGTPAGSQPDMTARIVGEKLGATLGQGAVVENVAGGGGLIAAARGAHSPADGYTYYLGGLSVVATDKWMFKSLPYDPDKDFTPVAMLSDSNSFVMAVHPSVKATSVAELIALAKSEPGKLTYGFTQIGVTTLVGLWFNKLAGVDMTAIPYKDVGSLLQDTISGRVPVVISTFDEMQAHLESGELRALGVTSAQRVAGHDDVPAIAETLPGYRAQGFSIVFAPTGTPADIVQKLNRAIDPIVKEDSYVNRLKAYGVTIRGGAGSPESIAAFEKAERDNWANIFTKLQYEPL